ncbi:unnamed protein product [Brassicogethes aeneus]|uniref:Glycosyltransferase 2-like domain-containing protein n=1 Tax=Brassicogethes aeneus TaxID=1431903 RepID=A0A9P0ARF6_BRAAE|nr:unnamed protein product [Brassicogethes aeneus]
MLQFNPIISVIIPIHNGSRWIENCFNSILEQTAIKSHKIELCVCNDASNDDTDKLLKAWSGIFKNNNVKVKIYHNESEEPKGVGFSKNRAISISSGDFLCFQDVDDVMLPNRILRQYEAACILPKNTLIGSKFKRTPENSTVRYTKWANLLNKEELQNQIFTSFGPTVIMPTWFFHRSLYEEVGGFLEEKIGCPEDLIFFYKHLDNGGKIYRVDEELLVYTYHLGATTFLINKDTIWDKRVERLQKTILNQWPAFTIWNAGKQGRKLYKSLAQNHQNKVVAMCDVDVKKIGKTYVPFDAAGRKIGRPVKIVSFKEANAPLVICVKLDLTNGVFEHNLKTLNLVEGKDYVLFS